MEKLTKNKPQHFRTIFIKYLVAFCVMMLMLVLLAIGIFLGVLYTGAVLPANAIEMEVTNSKENIAKSENVTPDLIPSACDYAVFTSQGKYISGNLSPENATKLWEAAKNGSTISRSFVYTLIERKNGEICVLRYVIKPTYSSKWANNYFPSPDIMFVVLFLIFFMVGIILLATHFGRNMSKKITSLNEVTEKIQNQDLDFTIVPSGVYEIDNVLSSMDKMRESLKTSLKRQWELEHSRKEQLSALAHDIKAPVTVIKGNVELLSETPQNESQIEYLGYIKDGTNQLEQYVRQMIEVSKAQELLSFNIQEADVKNLLEEMETQMKGLASLKQISINVEAKNHFGIVQIDREFFMRAFLNILANAIDHTPKLGTVSLNVNADENEVMFSIIDGGKGFTQDDLKNAKSEFYMGDKSRTQNGHYGMGLFIADSILTKHGGKLILKNAENGGACVIMRIPIKG